MGLFDFIKKNKETKTITKNDGTYSGTSSAFKGDLASFNDNKQNVNTGDVGTIPKEKAKNLHNPDSKDCIVFMTFCKMTTNTWCCTECGTINDDSYDGCIVCGQKRYERK